MNIFLCFPEIQGFTTNKIQKEIKYRMSFADMLYTFTQQEINFNMLLLAVGNFYCLHFFYNV